MISKSELIKKAAGDVRQIPELFAAYIHYYTEEKGRKPNCSGCSFKSVFEGWKRQANKSFRKPIAMSTSNTFKINRLKYKGIGIYVPNNGEVITDSSPDELAVEFLMQNDGKLLEKRKSFFDVLPEALREKPKKVAKVKKEEPVAMDKKDSTPDPKPVKKAVKKRTAKPKK